MTRNKTEISVKQAEYIREANSRWNVKMGATQSGKTHLDTLYVIPSRIYERKGLKGIYVIVGVSKETIERNVLTKLRDIYGNKHVSEINSRNVATLFGEKVYCLGANNKAQTSRFRGATIKYLYIDEFVDISKDVFDILPSRLSLDYSMADMTGNPKDPNHWSEKWLARTENLYFQRYTLDDNPFLSREVKNSIKKDYEGTVFYDRYVLGLPKRAEGLIYPYFADSYTDYYIDNVPKIKQIAVGLDFGKSRSKHALVFVGETYDNTYVVIKSVCMPTNNTDTEQLYQWVKREVTQINEQYKVPITLNGDGAEPMLILSLKKYIPFCRLQAIAKISINMRIKAVGKLLSNHWLKFLRHSTNDVVEALYQSSWKDDAKSEDVRLDDGSFNNDVIDALEYALTIFNIPKIMGRE